MEVEPIDAAKDWLKMAELAMEVRKYAQAAYSLEMAVEIALKAVLISVHVEVPKVHDIRKAARMFLAGNRSLPKSFLEELDDFLATFETLLRLRPIVGYGFETGTAKSDIKEQAERLLPKCKIIIAECEKAAKHVDKEGGSK